VSFSTDEKNCHVYGKSKFKSFCGGFVSLFENFSKFAQVSKRTVFDSGFDLGFC
jgi:hypothetical protein